MSLHYFVTNVPDLVMSNMEPTTSMLQTMVFLRTFPNGRRKIFCVTLFQASIA